MGALRLPSASVLRQVVTERSEDHVVGTLRSNADARPDVALGIRVLNTLTDTSGGTVVEVVPVPQSQLLHVFGVRGAVAWCCWGVAGDRCARNRFGVAAGFHVGIGAVSDRGGGAGLEVAAPHVVTTVVRISVEVLVYVSVQGAEG